MIKHFIRYAAEITRRECRLGWLINSLIGTLAAMIRYIKN